MKKGYYEYDPVIYPRKAVGDATGNGGGGADVLHGA